MFMKKGRIDNSDEDNLKLMKNCRTWEKYKMSGIYIYKYKDKNKDGKQKCKYLTYFFMFSIIRKIYLWITFKIMNQLRRIM